jgi:mono/diheme cytochrome c family protein
MKRLTIVLAVLALAVSATWALAETEIKQAPISWEQASLGDGEALYVELCAVCHGVTGKGDGPAAPALAKPLSDLTRLAADNDGEFPAASVEKAITGVAGVTAHGTVDMPVWGKVFEDVRPDHKPAQRWTFARSRIYNLTEYLRTLQAE